MNAEPRFQPTFTTAGYDGYNDENDVAATSNDQQSRMTPSKFISAHVKGVFGANGLFVNITGKNPQLGQSATVEMHVLQSVLREQNKDLENFPGPLVPGRTHKGEVIQFCQSKIQASKNNPEIVDKDSYKLIWELLILLLRQKNTIDGSDISELLLKDREVQVSNDFILIESCMYSILIVLGAN